MLDVVRVSLGVQEDEHALLEREVRLETYREALRSAWKSGLITSDDLSTGENLRKLYGLGKEDHLVIEAAVMNEMKATGRTE
jgi:hypothetical protein